MALNAPPGAQFGVPASSPPPLRGDILLPSIAPLDQSGLTFAGGGTLAGDYDYSEPVGTPVFLPTGGVFTLLKDYVDQFGSRIQAWGIGPPNRQSGVFEYVHLSTDYEAGQTLGTIVQGGTEVGLSGMPTNPRAGSGAHLAVIADTAAARFLSNGTGVPLYDPGGPSTDPLTGLPATGQPLPSVQSKPVGTDWGAAKTLAEAALAFGIAVALLIAIADTKLYPLAFGVAGIALLYALVHGGATAVNSKFASFVLPHLK